MNISEIAKMAGVSRAAVSRYLNNGYLSNEKREIIAKVIAETGYMPSSQAQTLRTKRTKIIGVIIPKIDSDSISQIVSGISEVLSASGYQMLLANTENQPEKELDYINTFRQNMVDGIILLGTSLDDAKLKNIQELDIPVVILGQFVSAPSCIYHDDYHAAVCMTEQLIKKGYHNIGYIGVSKNDTAVGVLRQQGFLDTMRAHHLAVPEDMVITGSFYMENGYEHAPLLLERHPELDAILCATDTVALGVIKYLNEQGILIPTQIAVAGFGDSRVSSILQPSLTTIHFYYHECGVEGTKMLLEKLQNPEIPNKSIKLGFELILNDSI